MHSLYKKLQLLVKTATKSKLSSDYIFGELVPMAFGQGNTVFQYAIRGSELYCAKIGDPETIEAEVAVSQLIHEDQHCPSVMPVLDCIKIDENRAAMMSPFYPLTVSHTTVNDATLVNVALCGLATVKAFSNKNMCHGDIKPSNMMFQAGNRVLVSIDFGSSSIVFFSGVELDDIATREDARSQLAMRTGLHFSIAGLCLDDDNVVDLDVLWGKCKSLVENSLPSADWVVDLDELWPKNDIIPSRTIGEQLSCRTSGFTNKP